MKRSASVDRLKRLLLGMLPLTPPRAIRCQVGPYRTARAYRAVGREFVGYLRELGRLTPDGALLDMGCGCGQVAAPLTRWLSPRGRYEGVDVAPDLVDWCRARIAPRHPGFRFTRADIRNPHYNPGGKEEEDRYRFPFDDGTFDVVLLKSVFTHMRPPALRHYLSEVRRTLRRGGRCLVTYFLLTPESRSAIETGSSSLPFRHALEGCRTIDPADPEKAVAYEEEAIRVLYRDEGLDIVEPVRRGAWPRSDARAPRGYQDLVVASRR